MLGQVSIFGVVWLKRAESEDILAPLQFTIVVKVPTSPAGTQAVVPKASRFIINVEHKPLRETINVVLLAQSLVIRTGQAQ